MPSNIEGITEGMFDISPTPTCIAMPCDPYHVPFSADYAEADSITARTSEVVLITCLPGYTTAANPVAGDVAISSVTTCEANAVENMPPSFTPVVCTPIPCFHHEVGFSDYVMVDSIMGATTDATDVTCDLGYTGSAVSTCMPGSTFSAVTCTANPCVPTQIPFSSHKAEGAVFGVTSHADDNGRVDFRCDRGWSNGEPGTARDPAVDYTDHEGETWCRAGCRDCDTEELGVFNGDTDGVFDAVECIPNPCVSVIIDHSDYGPGYTECLHPLHCDNLTPQDADEGLVEGFCMETVSVTCDPGYSKFGEWGFPEKTDITDRHIIEQPIMCNPSDESPGFFDDASCLPNPCDPRFVAHSDHSETYIEGVTDASVLVACDTGYEIFDGGVEGRFAAETICLTNGTFSYLECAPISRLELIFRNKEDIPSMTGVDNNGVAVWQYAMETFHVDYFAAPFLTGMDEMNAFVSVMFRVTHNTIAFVTGGGTDQGGVASASRRLSASDGAVVSLVTDFEGSYYTGEGGVVRRSHSPSSAAVDCGEDEDCIPHEKYEVAWEVAGLIGRKAVITVDDAFPNAELLLDDIRMYEQQQGCLSECLVINAVLCLSEFDLPQGTQCFYFNGDSVPYVPVKVVEHVIGEPPALTQFCAMGKAPFGENGQARLSYGFEDGVISTQRILQYPQLPTCLYIQVVSATSFGFALAPEDPIMVLDANNAPAASTDDQLHCLYETTKPRCADFDGPLKDRTQHHLYCEEIEPELSCMELVYDKKCPAGMKCGSNEQGVPDQTTLNLMQCCDRANNDPGSGCLARRRRLSTAKSTVTNAIITDVEASEACAMACLRRANGPTGNPQEEACIAWRLDENSGECVISVSCYTEVMAEVKLLGKKLWNTFENVNPLKDATLPAPKRVRIKYEVAADH
jgi:hypothetical protein